MTTKQIAVLGTAFLALAACTPQEQQQAADTLMQSSSVAATASSSAGDAMMQQDAMMQASSAAAMIDAGAGTQAAAVTKGRYTGFRPEVLADGQIKVLFFHASWCPICKAGDSKLTQWYGSQEFPITVYKVDYDNADDLKATYGVTYQHTFVKVDGQGNALQVLQGPTDAQLQAMLKA